MWCSAARCAGVRRVGGNRGLSCVLERRPASLFLSCMLADQPLVRFCWLPLCRHRARRDGGVRKVSVDIRSNPSARLSPGAARTQPKPISPTLWRRFCAASDSSTLCCLRTDTCSETACKNGRRTSQHTGNTALKTRGGVQTRQTIEPR